MKRTHRGAKSKKRNKEIKGNRPNWRCLDDGTWEQIKNT